MTLAKIDLGGIPVDVVKKGHQERPSELLSAHRFKGCEFRADANDLDTIRVLRYFPNSPGIRQQQKR